MSRGTRNKIEDLRDHLFATLESLRDADSPMELDRAKAISEVAQTIINSAKVEIDHLRLISTAKIDLSGTGTRFIPTHEPERGTLLTSIQEIASK